MCLHLNIKVQCVELGVEMEFNFANCVFINVLLLETTESFQMHWAFKTALNNMLLFIAPELYRASWNLLAHCFAFMVHHLKMKY